MERRISRAMVKKLLKANGLSVKMSTWIRNCASSHSMTQLLNDEERSKIISQCMSDDQMLNLFADLYGEYFSVEEMLDMISLFKRPIYQKILKIQDEMAIKMAGIVMDIATKVSLSIMKAAIKKDPRGPNRNPPSIGNS